MFFVVVFCCCCCCCFGGSAGEKYTKLGGWEQAYVINPNQRGVEEHTTPTAVAAPRVDTCIHHCQEVMAGFRRDGTVTGRPAVHLGSPDQWSDCWQSVAVNSHRSSRDLWRSRDLRSTIWRRERILYNRHSYPSTPTLLPLSPPSSESAKGRVGTGVVQETGDVCGLNT